MCVDLDCRDCPNFSCCRENLENLRELRDSLILVDIRLMNYNMVSEHLEYSKHINRINRLISKILDVWK